MRKWPLLDIYRAWSSRCCGCPLCCSLTGGLVLHIGITSCTFPPQTEVCKKHDYEKWLWNFKDYKLCQFFSLLTIRFLCNCVPLHDCVINTTNVEFLGKMRCVREGNAIICTSSTWRTENKISYMSNTVTWDSQYFTIDITKCH